MGPDEKVIPEFQSVDPRRGRTGNLSENACGRLLSESPDTLRLEQELLK